MPLNQVTIQGRLVREANILKNKNDKSYCFITLATERFAGEGNKKTIWVECVAYGKTSEIIAKYVNKGQEIIIAGYLDNGMVIQLEEKIKKNTMQVIISEIHFTNRIKGNEEESADELATEGTPNVSEEDLPF